ncbi:MAG: Ig-like domain-containing protein [Candidatus Omnitrophota bacterium]
MRRPIQGLQFLSLIFAFLYLTPYSARAFASEINNSALVSYKISSLQQQISSNATSTTINLPTGATIIAPQNNSTVPQNLTVIGTTTANASVEIKIDGITRYSLTSDVNGYYAQEVSISTTSSHTITVYANGAEGETIEIEVVSGTPTNYPKIESPADGERITNRRPQVTGRAAPNSSIIIYAKASPVRIVGIGSSNSS